MVRCFWCPSCNQWGRRFQYGCRKCRIGEFKHSKCGRWVTAQYGFCPKCYPERLEPKPRKVFNKRDKEKEKEKEIMSRMSRGWRTDTRYVFTDKPTMPKGWKPPEYTISMSNSSIPKPQQEYTISIDEPEPEPKKEQQPEQAYTISVSVDDETKTKHILCLTEDFSVKNEKYTYVDSF